MISSPNPACRSLPLGGGDVVDEGPPCSRPGDGADTDDDDEEGEEEGSNSSNICNWHIKSYVDGRGRWVLS